MDGAHTAIAIGVGCKKGCAAGPIIGVIERALAAASRPGAKASLFTHTAKKDEPGLAGAARAMGLPLVFLGPEILRQASSRTLTHSPKVMALYGLPSLAETAALAGAGPAAVLLVARMSAGGASCAIAGCPSP